MGSGSSPALLSCLPNSAFLWAGVWDRSGVGCTPAWPPGPCCTPGGMGGRQSKVPALPCPMVPRQGLHAKGPVHHPQALLGPLPCPLGTHESPGWQHRLGVSRVWVMGAAWDGGPEPQSPCLGWQHCSTCDTSEHEGKHLCCSCQAGSDGCRNGQHPVPAVLSHPRLCLGTQGFSRSSHGCCASLCVMASPLVTAILHHV